MDKKLPKKRMFLMLLGPLGYILNVISRNNKALTEELYSTGIYRGISWFLGNLFGWFPFSVAEIFFPILVLAALVAIIVWAVRLINIRKDRWYRFRNGIINVLLVANLLYFSFIFLWGLNYNRQTFACIISLEVRPSTLDELVEMTEDLIEHTNILRYKVEEDEEGVMVPFGGAESAFARSKEGYIAVSEYIPFFDHIYGRAKPLLFSPVIAYTNIWGIYCPFTAEPNVNIMIPTPMLINTMMHEYAHQLGFAREDEANYISFLTCSSHPDVDFQYSGYLSALNYSLNAVYRQDRDVYRQLYSKLSEGVKRDLKENSKYHQKYDGPVRETFSKTNDAYLKANNQQDGEKSYGRMVDLLLAQYREKTKEHQ